MFKWKNNNATRKVGKKLDGESKASPNVPKLVQIQFAQFLNNLLEYANELTYFSINAFQTSSLRRVQMNTLVKQIFFADCYGIFLATLHRILCPTSLCFLL